MVQMSGNSTRSYAVLMKYPSYHQILLSRALLGNNTNIIFYILLYRYYILYILFYIKFYCFCTLFILLCYKLKQKDHLITSVLTTSSQ